jgi:hypothetical protein
MPDFLAFLLRLLASPFRSNLDLEIEVLALRQQLAVYQRSIPRPRLHLRDRLFWTSLSRLWSRWKDALVIVKPSTVIAWRRRKSREYWAKLSGAAVHDPRPRRHLRLRVPGSREGDGHQGGAHRAALAVAVALHRAPHRQRSP